MRSYNVRIGKVLLISLYSKVSHFIAFHNSVSHPGRRVSWFSCPVRAWSRLSEESMCLQPIKTHMDHSRCLKYYLFLMHAFLAPLMKVPWNTFFLQIEQTWNLQIVRDSMAVCGRLWGDCIIPLYPLRINSAWKSATKKLEFMDWIHGKFQYRAVVNMVKKLDLRFSQLWLTPFWVVMLCSWEGAWHCRGTYHLDLQSWRISQTRKWLISWANCA
jgi:hypothetical protein